MICSCTLLLLLSSFVAVSNGNTCRLSELSLTEEKIYSQNGEDGILLHLFESIGVTNRQYVEFGVEDGTECNTRILRETLNFTGLMMDGGHSNEKINLKQEFVSVDNVLHLFEKYEVPFSFDLLSVDTDAFDWWLLLRILRDGRYRPRVIVVEVNPTLGVGLSNFREEFTEMNRIPLTMIEPHLTDLLTWDLSRYSGANPIAFQKLGKLFGYDMLYCERCGVNCIMMHRDSLPLGCENTFVALPSVHYPCFGTARTGGAHPGHEVDRLMRRPVFLSDSLLALLAKNSHSLSDITEGLISPTIDYPLWGSDWCTCLLDIPLSARQAHLNVTNNARLDRAMSFFRYGQYYKAKNEFVSLMNEVLDGELTCTSKHWSDSACAITAALRYNVGVTHLHLENLKNDSLLRESSMALSDAANTILVGSYGHKIRSISNFISAMNQRSPFKLSIAWFSFSTDLSSSFVIKRRIMMDVCSDHEQTAHMYCKSNNIPSDACNSIKKRLREGYEKDFVRFPTAYYSVNSNEMLKQYQWPLLVGDMNSFTQSGCMQTYVAKYLSHVQSFCVSIVETGDLVLLSGFSSNSIITAVTIVLRSMLSGKQVEDKKLELNKVTSEIENMEKILFSLLDIYGCSLSVVENVTMHPALLDVNCLKKVASDEITSEMQATAVSSVLNDIYANIYTSSQDVMVYGNAMFSFTRSYWKDAFRGTAVHHLLIAPPVEVAVIGLSLELKIPIEQALERFIQLTNAAIEALSQSLGQVHILTLSDKDNITLTGLITHSNISRNSNKNPDISLYLNIVTTLMGTIAPLKRSVQIPYYFYKCYELMRSQLLLPNSPCVE